MATDEFATEVLADGPVGYWRFGEPLGSATAADASGHGNDGLASGGVTFGKPGLHGGDTAALFDGATGRITVANSEYDGLAIAIYLNGALDSTTTVNASPVDIETKWPHSPPDDPEVALRPRGPRRDHPGRRRPADLQRADTTRSPSTRPRSAPSASASTTRRCAARG